MEKSYCLNQATRMVFPGETSFWITNPYGTTEVKPPYIKVACRSLLQGMLLVIKNWICTIYSISTLIIIKFCVLGMLQNKNRTSATTSKSKKWSCEILRFQKTKVFWIESASTLGEERPTRQNVQGRTHSWIRKTSG